MKKVIALTLALATLASPPSFAGAPDTDMGTGTGTETETETTETDMETEETPEDMPGEEGDVSELDERDGIFCSVAMVRHRRVVRRYYGRRNLYTWRCQAPMRRCWNDLPPYWRWRGYRCVELR